MPTHEIEAKFEIADPSQVSRLAKPGGLPAGFELSPLRMKVTTDVYYDTPGFRLLRGGYVLRVRYAPNGVLLTLKGLERTGMGLIHERLELEGPLTSPDTPTQPDGWPQPVHLAVLGVLGGIPKLVPLCLLRQRRSIGNVSQPPEPAAEATKSPADAWAIEPGHAQPDGDTLPAGQPDLGLPRSSARAPGAQIAELSIDEVAVYDVAELGDLCRTPDMELPAEPVASFHELELELLDEHQREAFERLAKFLAAKTGLRTSSQSKLERALGLVAAHPPASAPDVVGIQTGQAMAEAGRLVWRVQLVAILLNEAGARRGGDIEYVHDMRVATRRARSAARLFAAYFLDKAIKPFDPALRRTGGTLGAVRDLDVQLDKLARFAQSLPEGEAQELDHIAEAWRREQAEARRALFDWLDGKAFRRFIADWAAFCATPGLGARAVDETAKSSPLPTVTPYQVRHVMPSRILGRFEQVRCYEAVFESGEPIPEPMLHALRIDCKRLRYALEPVTHLLGEDGEQLVKQLKHLQDHLGDLNDASVTRDRLRLLQGQGNDPGIERYLAVQDEIIAELVGSFPEVWKPFIAPSNRRLLARAVARL